MSNKVKDKYYERVNSGEKPYQIIAGWSVRDTNELAEEFVKEIKNGTFDVRSYSKNVSKIRKEFDFAKHLGEYGDSYENEKPLCRSWFNNHDAIPESLKQFGTIIEYECNLIEGDFTNIDLVSFARIDGRPMFYLWEVKGSGKVNTIDNCIYYKSNNNIVRAILEIETYYQTLLKNGNMNSFKKTIGKHLFEIKDRNKAEIKKIVVLPKDSKEARQSSNNAIKELAFLLDVKIVCFDSLQPVIDRNKLIDSGNIHVL